MFKSRPTLEVSKDAGAFIFGCSAEQESYASFVCKNVTEKALPKGPTVEFGTFLVLKSICLSICLLMGSFVLNWLQ